ncbi:MAG: hypothetical protein FJZ89_08210 [Chloroflexi bacterium]|nr:hypothetical protein [Chloroflexota bacterium]
MSKFVELLRQAARGGESSMGFSLGRKAAAQRAALLLAVTLPRNDEAPSRPPFREARRDGASEEALARIALEAGADALVLPLHAPGDREVILKLAGERPCGIMAEDRLTPADLAALAETGFDFAILYAHHAPADLQAAKIGRVIAVDHTCGERLLATLNVLDVDAVLAAILPPAEQGQPLTFQALMRYRLLADLVRQPLIVPAQAALRPEDVATLWHAGAEALLLSGPVLGESAESLRTNIAAFRQAIAALPRTRRFRRAAEERVVLPAITPAALEEEQEW